MRLFRRASPLLPLLLCGCGYIHFGRLPIDRRGDAALQQAYSDLALEHKILKQELVLAHKENDSLRAALDRAGGSTGTSTAELAQQLEKTTKELATVRADYFKLQNERSRAATPASTMASADATALRDENARLRHDLEASRQENATLAEKLKASVADNEQAQASLTQLNTELLDAKQARERAEQATVALRAQLEAVMARAERADSIAPAAAAAISPASAAPVGPPANPLAALQSAKSPPSGAVPIVELRTSPDRARAAATASLAAGASSPVASPATDVQTPTVTPAAPQAAAPRANEATMRTYIVQPGDTLEKIAVKMDGAQDEWGKIYAANADALSASQGLKPGMKLEIPEK